MKKVDFPRVVAGSLGATFIFFVLSNLGVWAQNIMYPMTFGGLVACYTAALPFLKYTLAGDLFYSGLLFLAYERYMRSLLREDKITR